MYRQCTTKKTAQQQKIFYEALYEMMQVHLYRDITITDLCNHAGLSRNIFYRLFDSKDDVLYTVIDSHFFECSTEIHADSIEENMKKFFSYWKSQKDFLDILEKNKLESLLPIRAVLCCCRMDFGMLKFITPDWNEYNIEILAFYINGFIGLLFQWYHNDFSRTVDEMCEIALQILNVPPITVE